MLNRDTFINVPAVPRDAVRARLFTTADGGTTNHTVTVAFEDVGAPDESKAVFWAQLAAPSPEGSRRLDSRHIPLTSPRRGPGNARLVPPEAVIDHVLLVGAGSEIPGRIQPNEAYLPYSAWGAQTRIEVPLLTYQIPFDIKNELRNVIDPTLTLGSFADSFAELDEHAQGLKEMPLEAVRDFLEEKRRDVDRNVQLLGLSFPASSLSLWGAAFLAMIQSYFFLSMRCLFARLQEHDLQFPWIAFYEDRLARVAFVASAFFAPVAVIVFISRASFWPHLQFEGLMGHAPVLVLAVAASAGGLIEYRRRILARGN